MSGGGSPRPPEGPLWIGEPFELFYSAFPYPLLLETNGFPECYDYHKANQIIPLLKRIRKAGGKTYTDKENIAYHAGHRGWGGSLWYQSNRRGKGILFERENCFNLREHKRSEFQSLGTLKVETI